MTETDAALTHVPRCNFWCRGDTHYLMPGPTAHAWTPDPRPFMRDCCQVCGGAFHQPTSPTRGPDELTNHHERTHPMSATECDETDPECRCPDCVNAASDIANTTR